ncbi:MAG TPA: hypothetical protein VHE81_08580, partial [Lacipirellulaceae bacterium]|nr:hypothetical protein [Lacipirellulaceae bacterium]
MADLLASKPVRADLPGGGRLHIERRIPLMCVYRKRATDAGIEEIIGGEPAFMILPDEPPHARNALKLLRTTVEHLAKDLGGFLLVEVWAKSQAQCVPLAAMIDGESDGHSARFEISAPAMMIPRHTIQSLCKSLGRDTLPFGGAQVTLQPYDAVAPPGTKPLLRLRECRDWNCYLLGIVARPVYRQDALHELNAAAMHSMSRDLHIALEQANFAFVRQRKTLRPAHFHAPERRSVVKSVLDIDRQLAEIDRSFDLLLQATPVNAESAWREFRRSRFEKPPVFYYRPLSVDPVLLKRR